MDGIGETVPTQRELIDAMNLMCRYVMDHLPSGYVVTLSMDSDEASIDLIDPDGNSVEPFDCEDHYSAVAACCDAAKMRAPS